MKNIWKVILPFLLFLFGNSMAFNLTSTAFENAGSIPMKYTCEGADISPPLNWEDVPTGIQSLVLIMHDPDASNGNWIHWVLYNIPPDVTELKENEIDLAPGTINGRNSWNKLNYGGPCPPQGRHRYFFHLYGLDRKFKIAGANVQQIEKMMKGHVLREVTLMGYYQKTKRK